MTFIQKFSDLEKKILKRIKPVINRRVLIGIPEEERKSNEQLTNAYKLYIHSKGSPAKGIPARPLLEPALEASMPFLSSLLKDALLFFLKGNTTSGDRSMNQAGNAGVSAVRKWFSDPENGWEPLSPSTIRAKGSDAPLIDTGAMRQSITYFIEGGREKP